MFDEDVDVADIVFTANPNFTQKKVLLLERYLQKLDEMQNTSQRPRSPDSWREFDFQK
jgi:hypothetical protein